jgi:hypothetical protein
VTADLRWELLHTAGIDAVKDGLGNVLVRCAATGRRWQPVTDAQALELIGATKS